MATVLKKRKICVVTGSRAEYGLLRPVMEAIAGSSRLNLAVVVSGMHLSSVFGLTVKEIEKDGFLIDARIKMTPSKDSAGAMAQSVGVGIIGMATVFKKIKPDVVLVLGDRVEPLAAAIAAAYSNIVVAHIHGGDSARAGLDENARHAITKFAHLHFAATAKSAKRIIRMGEDPRHVFISGAPGLDSVLHTNKMSVEELDQKYSLDQTVPFLLVVQHSVTTEIRQAAQQMAETMKAVSRFGYRTLIIGPNADAGGRSMARVIKEYCRRFNFMTLYPSIPHIDYLGLLRRAAVLVGNSSSGMIESSLLNTPVVNVGIRQEGRECSTNVIHVPHSENAIFAAIKRALVDVGFKRLVKKCGNSYGCGRAGEIIADVLANVRLGDDLLKKKITY